MQTPDARTTMTADLEALPLDELRRRRDAVRVEEEQLSYRRRLLHAQLDLVQASRRVDEDHDLESMLGRILADDDRGAAGVVRAVSVRPHPGADDVEPLPADLVGLDDDERARLLERLQAAERATSERRRELLDELDELQAELVRRYRRDGVDARQLMGGQD